MGCKEDLLLHEVCHWILAPDKYKKYPDYLLGRGPKSDINAYCEILKSIDKNLPLCRSNGLDEELLTCVLEFCFAAMTYDSKYLIWLMRDRNFLNYYKNKIWESDSITDQIKILKKKRVINKDWIPTILNKKNMVTEKHRAKMLKFRELVKEIDEKSKLKWNNR